MSYTPITNEKIEFFGSNKDNPGLDTLTRAGVYGVYNLTDQPGVHTTGQLVVSAANNIIMQLWTSEDEMLIRRYSGTWSGWLSYVDVKYSKLEILHNITTDANYTLTPDQNSYGRIKITDTNPFLTGAVDIIVSDDIRNIVAINDTAEILNYKTSAGGGIPVLPNDTMELYCDGIDIIRNNIRSLFAEYIVEGSAETTIEFTGLDINNHKSYRIEIEWVEGTGASGRNLRMYINGDETTTNYYSHESTFVTTGVHARTNTAEIAYNLSGNHSFSVIDLGQYSDGYCHAQSTSTTGLSSGMERRVYGWSAVTSRSNITSIAFNSGAGALGIGTRIRIYRGDM